MNKKKSAEMAICTQSLYELLTFSQSEYNENMTLNKPGIYEVLMIRWMDGWMDG